jgi:hypothetical protein
MICDSGSNIESPSMSSCCQPPTLSSMGNIKFIDTSVSVWVSLIKHSKHWFLRGNQKQNHLFNRFFLSCSTLRRTLSIRLLKSTTGMRKNPLDCTYRNLEFHWDLRHCHHLSHPINLFFINFSLFAGREKVCVFVHVTRYWSCLKNKPIQKRHFKSPTLKFEIYSIIELCDGSLSLNVLIPISFHSKIKEFSGMDPE